MAAKIIIQDLGPIESCELTLNNFTILTGAQASGKSTIAKCIYFCKTVKDDIYQVILKKAAYFDEYKLMKRVTHTLRGKFLQMFGTSMAMKETMKLRYEYAPKTYIEITLSLSNPATSLLPKFVYVRVSRNIAGFVNQYDAIEPEQIESDNLKAALNRLFKDEQETIFIPAGRSMITLLTSQLNYMFATMDDNQKRSIDFCTQRYVERILKIRPLFQYGIDGMIYEKRNQGFYIPQETIDLLLDITNQVLKGRYVFKDNEEVLYLDADQNSNRYVKLNYTSSGQQESVWIFNILFYLLANNTKAYIILEEPEAHLYPNAQMHMAEALALMSNHSCGMLITTHSPYILGAVNNLIYAQYLTEKQLDVSDIISPLLRIQNHDAYFVEQGSITPCLEDNEYRLIVNEVIDDASSDINEMYDKLFNCEMQDGGSYET